MADRRAQRRKELEEKKRRLEEMRKAKQGKGAIAAAVEPATEKKEQEKRKLEAVSGSDSVESLLSVLETDIPGAGKIKDPDDTPAETSPPEEKAPQPVIERHTPELTTQNEVSVFTFAPKDNAHGAQRIPTYSRGTQTRERVEGAASDEEHEGEVMRGDGAGDDARASGVDQGAATTNSSLGSEPVRTSRMVHIQVKKPEEVDENTKVQILSDDAVVGFLDSASKTLERSVRLNAKYDVLVDYAVADAGTSSDGGLDLNPKQVLFDKRWSTGRAITSIDWSPKFSELLLASYSSCPSSHDPDGLVLVWSTPNLLERPEYVFTTQSQVLVAVFNPFNPNVVVGGTYSGQLVMWDMRAGSSPVQCFPLSPKGHTHPVYALQVVGSEHAHNLVSVSTDGRMCSWTLDNLREPLDVLDLKNRDGKGITTTVAPTCMTFPSGEEGSSAVNRCHIGSEDGGVYSVVRHGSSQGISDKLEGHYGWITAVHQHPVNGTIDHSSLLLSSSADHTIRMWSIKEQRTVMLLQGFSDYVVDVQWSPRHPAVFAAADASGEVSLWDVSQNYELPISRTVVTEKTASRVRWGSGGRMLAVGDGAGVIHLIDVPENVSSSTVCPLPQWDGGDAADGFVA